VNVTDLFTRLSYGELSNLSISGNGSGEIVEARQPQIIQFANEALLRLYSRFVLLERDLILLMSDDITTYHLHSDHAYTNPDPDPGDSIYIQDSENSPFNDDLIKILQVYDPYINLLPLNDNNDVYSVFTPSPTVLQVPLPTEGDRLTIIYQAKHPVLSIDDLSTQIILPPTLEGALTSYIAQLVY
jgi:hypothetical protein